MNLIMLGAPGVGKGTQAVKISKELRIPHISTGDIFRDAVSKGTELGKKAKEFMDAGELVPDDIVVAIVLERIKNPDCKNGFILDGFPRTDRQAEALDETLSGMGQEINGVLLIDAPESEVINRITGRRVCRDCGKVFHIVFNPSSEGERCSNCGGMLYQRDDDKVDTAIKRHRVYMDQTAPLIEYYGERDVLKRIDGKKKVEEVFAAIKESLDL